MKDLTFAPATLTLVLGIAQKVDGYLQKEQLAK